MVYVGLSSGIFQVSAAAFTPTPGVQTITPLASLPMDTPYSIALDVANGYGERQGVPVGSYAADY